MSNILPFSTRSKAKKPRNYRVIVETTINWLAELRERRKALDRQITEAEAKLAEAERLLAEEERL
jgi:hypothetical protein